MESSAVARYIPQKSKKRVFPGSSSSAMEPEAIEISDFSVVSVDRKPKSVSRSRDKGKQKQVPFHDVDMDEDRSDVVFIDGKVGSNKKMKGAMGLSLGSGSSAQFDSKKEVAPGHLPKGFTPGSNNFFDLDDYVFDDDYDNLQALFDNMDLPTGIEAPISWLPDLVDIKKKHKSASAYLKAMEQSNGEEVPAQNMPSSYTGFGSGYYFTNNFNSQVGSSTSGFPAVPMDPVNPLGVDTPTLKLQKEYLKNHLDLNDAYLSADILSNSGDLGEKKVPSPKRSRKVRNSSSKVKLGNDDVSKKFEGFKKFDTVVDHSNHSMCTERLGRMKLFTSLIVPFHEINYVDIKEELNDVVFIEGRGGVNKKMKGAMGTSLGSGISAQSNSKKDVPAASSHFPKGFTPGSNNFLDLDDYVSNDDYIPLQAHSGNKDLPTGIATLPLATSLPSPKGSSFVANSSSMRNFVNVEGMKKYENFKKFDTVLDHSDHYYSTQNSAMNQGFPPPKNWAKKIQEEWKILEKDLPDTIFVRVYESRMDLLRAAIIGAEGTPYHDGLFFFDVCFPCNYPQNPPLVYYHSGGLRINPNLYPSGKVCLSLLNTWSGSANENWIPGTSTMLQVLVSIQGLILNTEPYFNEPGYEASRGTVRGKKFALDYNENTLILSLKTMVYTMKKQPKYFEDLVVGHFRHSVRDILMACKDYTEGVQVGSLMRGGEQDVDDGEESCSYMFKTTVVSYIKVLIDAFKNIGAKEAEEFLFLVEKKIPPTNKPAAIAAWIPTPPPGYFHGYGLTPSIYNPYYPNPSTYDPYYPNPPLTYDPYYPNPPLTYDPYNPNPPLTYDPYNPNPHTTYNPNPHTTYNPNPHTTYDPYYPKPLTDYDAKPPSTYHPYNPKPPGRYNPIPPGSYDY